MDHLKEQKESLICKLDNKDGVSYSQLFVGKFFIYWNQI